MRNENVMSGAMLSTDLKYRYILWRTWGHGPIMTFVMLNPSTADADEDDPTIRRCMGFARREHCQGIAVVNLFGLRASNPKELLTAEDPNGSDNRQEVSLALFEATSHGWPVVCAWGASPVAAASDSLALVRGYPRLFCLGVTKSGAPKHPLYLRKDAPLISWPLDNTPETC